MRFRSVLGGLIIAFETKICSTALMNLCLSKFSNISLLVTIISIIFAIIAGLISFVTFEETETFFDYLGIFVRNIMAVPFILICIALFLFFLFIIFGTVCLIWKLVAPIVSLGTDATFVLVLIVLAIVGIAASGVIILFFF